MFISLRIKKRFIVFIAAIVLLGALIPVSLSETLDKDNDCDENYIELPIIMYHGILDNSKLLGDYVIKPSEFKSDLEYIKKNGYTTIVVKDLIDYVYNGGELPEKPLMLTFDDGYYNNYVYAYPILKEYSFKAVLSPIGKCVDMYSENNDRGINYAHCTWDDINEMIASGCIEIQNHSYDMHTNGKRRGTKRKKGESLEHYKSVFEADALKMQQRVLDETGTQPTAFTFPFGAITKDSIDIIKDMGFKVSFDCYYKVNKITRDADCLYELHRFLRPSGIESEKYFNNILNN